MNLEVIHILEQISREKGIAREVLIDALKSAIEAAARKKLPFVEEIHCEFDETTGEVQIFSEKTIVDEVEDSNLEISLKDATELNPDVAVGERLLIPEVFDDFGRIAAQLAKQVILQKVKEAEIEIIYNEFIDKKGDIISGSVQRFEHGDIIVELGKTEGILPRREQVFRENFNRGERIRAYVVDVRKTPKNASVILSRTHTGLIKRLFEMEVPEISEGMVEIVGIAREPSGRTKITVRTNDRDIDAVGACVGMRGMRVQSIVQELRGEKIDIVEYSEDPQTFIRNALSPAKISRIILNEAERHMTLIVADDQMSLAIGKKGQNVRLAAKLVKWKVDIKGETEAQSLLQEHPDAFSKSTGAPKADLLEAVKQEKGLGEKIVSILFAGNVTTVDEVVKQGIDGLTQLPGIGPKKAQAILELAESLEIPEPVEVEPGEGEDDKADTGLEMTESPEEPTDEIESRVDEDAGKETVVIEEEAGDSEEPPEPSVADPETLEDPVAPMDTPAEEPEEEDEQDPLLSELSEVDPDMIALLEKNGFQTIPELSVTPVEELTAIEGMDSAIAESILQQAKKKMEEFENA